MTTSLKVAVAVTTSPALSVLLAASVALVRATLLTTGGMASKKVSLALRLPSLAVTVTFRSVVDVGVPLKVRVAASKLSQMGKAVPSPRVAE